MVQRLLRRLEKAATRDSSNLGNHGRYSPPVAHEVHEGRVDLAAPLLDGPHAQVGDEQAAEEEEGVHRESAVDHDLVREVGGGPREEVARVVEHLHGEELRVAEHDPAHAEKADPVQAVDLALALPGVEEEARVLD